MTTYPDGIWIIDADAVTLYANHAMAEMLGTTPENMVGTSSFDYLFAEDQPAARRLFESKRSGDNWPFHFRLRRQDGSSVQVDVQGTPMRNPEGTFIGIVGTFKVSAGKDGNADGRAVTSESK
jgi:PAS domain S-box-containing protein